MTWRRGRRWRAGLAAVACLTTVCALGQKAEDRPATDSAAQASPVTPAPASAKATDASSQASPAAGQAPRGGGALVAGSTVRVTLDRGIDSGRLHNGESVAARLASPVRTASGVVLPSGTAAVITVVETVPAGKLAAAGEFSLQLVRVGTVGTATDFLVYRGKVGQKDVADAAPALGTDAGLPAGAMLEFHVMGLPEPANGPPAREAEVPGAVNGTAPRGATTEPR